MEKEIDKKRNIWKSVAIIMIILFILETILFIGLLTWGLSMENSKVKCSNNICFNGGASSFAYDSSTKLCSCYDSAGEIIKEEFLE